ncbi:MAG TPA: helix-turn-helix domain-containing protein [Streptosporangiaceae bacterium]
METQITTAEAARRLDVTPITVRRWVEAGALVGRKIGDRVLVDATSVGAALARLDGRRPADRPRSRP